MKTLITALAVLFLISSCALFQQPPCPKENFFLYFMTPCGPFYAEIEKGSVDEHFRELEQEEENQKIEEMAKE